MAHLKELALFAGAGGGILGGKLLGWRTVCAVEIEPYCREVLMRRQDEGHLDPFPIWDDVRTFDGTEWRGKVDVVSGGFPCQDISVAGKGDGLDGERSGLWREMARIIGEVRPRFAFVENSPMLVRRGLARVLGDLAAMGYDCRWGVVSAADVGAPHLRERLWIVAHATEIGRSWWGEGHPRRVGKLWAEPSGLGSCQWWGENPKTQLSVLGVGDGLPDHMDAIECCGNGQVPAVAAAAWRILGGPDEDSQVPPGVETPGGF